MHKCECSKSFVLDNQQPSPEKGKAQRPDESRKQRLTTFAEMELPHLVV